MKYQIIDGRNKGREVESGDILVASHQKIRQEIKPLWKRIGGILIWWRRRQLRNEEKLLDFFQFNRIPILKTVHSPLRMANPFKADGPRISRWKVYVDPKLVEACAEANGNLFELNNKHIEEFEWGEISCKKD